MATETWHLFTLTDQRNDISTAQSHKDSAVFAPAEVVSRKPGVVELVVRSGNFTRTMEFQVSNTPLPAWIEPSLKRAGYLLLLPADWDRQGAPPIEPSAIQNALSALASFMENGSSLPQWTPTRQGGVQLDWHEEGIDLEIEFPPREHGATVVFSDRTNEAADWDGPLTQHAERLRTLFNERLTPSYASAGR
jgi:hypothetical protein